MVKFTVDNFDEYHVDKTVILKLIQQHQTIAQRIESLEAYYNGDHAIKERSRTKGAPNNRIAVNFAKYITDIATGYFISNPVTYNSSTGDDIDKLLLAFDRAHTDDTDADNAFELSQNGTGFEYVYVANGSSELRTKNLCARNCFMVYDTSIEENEVAAVYYRAVHDDAKDTVRYVATVLTQHLIYELNIMDCMIDLINAYNTVMSDRVNDIQDFVDAILVIYGTLLSDNGEEETGQAKTALRDGKLLEFPDKQNMGAEWLTRQLDENGVEILQKSIAKDIIRMSYVPDFSDESFAQNSSGVAIAYKCLLLEWMTKTKERYYRIGLRKRVRMFCRFLGLLEGHVSQKTLLQQLPFVEDPDAEIEALQKEADAELKRQQALFMMRPNTPPPEEDEEDETEE